MSDDVVKVMFVDPEAEKLGLPHYRKDGDAGFDLYVILPEDEREHGKTIFPGERALLDTGMHIQFPKGIYGRITHRSSTEKRLRLRVVEGTIDQGYRGRIFTQVSNDNSCKIEVYHGARIAQMILMPVITRPIIAVDSLDDSERGSDGFGSTGK